MITYKALFKFLDDGSVHAEVGDFPGVISCGKNLEDARAMLSSALVDMAETALLHGEALPKPGDAANDLDADLDEPIHLVLTASRRVHEMPEPAMA